MTVFVDTSALVALLDADQRRHGDVRTAWERVIEEKRLLLTSNYVLVECFALVQRRLGMEAVRGLADVLGPLLQTVWVDEEVHAASVSALLAAGRRRLSLVDCTSFEIMRRHGVSDVLALDDDFVEQGFQVLPPP